MPLAGVLLLTGCIPLQIYIWKNYIQEVKPTIIQKRIIDKDSRHPFLLIKSSKHLTYIALIVGISVMVAKLVDYQFGGMASRMIPDEEELTAFFGFWFSTFNVVSLFIQLFVTRHLVGTLGVGSSLLILPLFILIAVGLLIIMPELLLAAVFLKMSDIGLKQSVNKAAIELMIMPVSTEVKAQTKTFIDVFVDSMATGIVGLLLIFLINGLELSFGVINWMIVLLVFIWIYVVAQVRKEYIQLLQEKLSKSVIPSKTLQKSITISNDSVLNGWKKVLTQGDEKQILFVLEKLRGSTYNRMVAPIKQLLFHTSSLVRAEALRNLYFYKREDMISEVQQMISDKTLEVKIVAFEYLIHRLPDEKIMMEKFLNNPDYQIRGAALVSLARETKNNPVYQKEFNLYQLLRKAIQELQDSTPTAQSQVMKFILLKAIGSGQIVAHYKFIKQCFFDSDIEVVNHAITAAGQTSNQIFIDDLLYFLSNKTYETPAIKALKNYGRPIVAILKNRLEHQTIPEEVVKHLPVLLKKINYQEAVDLLFILLDRDDLTTKNEALKALNILRSNNPHLSFNSKYIVDRILEEANSYQQTLSVLYTQSTTEKQLQTIVPDEIIDARKSLMSLLEKRLDIHLERIFRLLVLKYPSKNMLTIYQSLKNDDVDFRSNALEFLENILELNLKKVLIPLVETSLLENITEETIRQLNLKVPTEEECYKTLLSGNDLRIKISVLYLLQQLKNPEYLSLVIPLLQHENLKLRDFAKLAEHNMRKAKRE